MVEFYRKKYGIETSISMWSLFLKRRNKGMPERLARNGVAVPWIVKNGPGRGNLAVGLRALDAIDNGKEVSPQQKRQAASVKRRSMADNVVVDYSPDENTFLWVPRRKGIDTGWIRDPFVADDGSPVVDLSHVRLDAFEERML